MEVLVDKNVVKVLSYLIAEKARPFLGSEATQGSAVRSLNDETAKVYYDLMRKQLGRSKKISLPIAEELLANQDFSYEVYLLEKYRGYMKQGEKAELAGVHAVTYKTLAGQVSIDEESLTTAEVPLGLLLWIMDECKMRDVIKVFICLQRTDSVETIAGMIGKDVASKSKKYNYVKERVEKLEKLLGKRKK